jgi:GT2 family glycosyltransferase
LDTLTRTLKRLTDLPERPGIVVIDNGSSDGTADAIRVRYPYVRIIALDRNLGAAGRNLGVRAARAPYVAFSDDDSWWAPGALSRASTYFASHPRLGGISARILVGPDERLDPTSALMARSPLNATAFPVRAFWGSWRAGRWFAERRFWRRPVSTLDMGWEAKRTCSRST